MNYIINSLYDIIKSNLHCKVKKYWIDDFDGDFLNVNLLLPINSGGNRGENGNFGLTLLQTDIHEYPALLIFVKICGYLAIFTIYFIDSLIYLISFKDGGIVHTSDGNESALLFLIITRK